MQEIDRPGRSESRAAWQSRLIPEGEPWINHDAECPYDMLVHIKAAFLPVSLSIGVAGDRMTLATREGIDLWKHHSRLHAREIAADPP